MSYCGPVDTVYGHDHLAIEAHFETDVPRQELEAQYTFRSANWEAVRSDMRKRLVEEPPPDAKDLKASPTTYPKQSRQRCGAVSPKQGRYHT